MAETDEIPVVTRIQRLRKEIKDGVGLEKMAELLYELSNDPNERTADRVAAAREWRQVMKDLGSRPAAQRSVKDDLAARRAARRRAEG